MHFDWTINLGSIISLVLFLGVLIKLHNDILTQLVAINVKVDAMWAKYIKDNHETHA